MFTGEKGKGDAASATNDANLIIGKAAAGKGAKGKKVTKAKGAEKPPDTTPLGRKDSQGNEAVMDQAELDAALPKLKKLLVLQQEATAAFNKANKVAAEKCGIQSSILKMRVVAECNGRMDIYKAKNAQMSFAFGMQDALVQD